LNCPICSREASDLGYCSMHAEAYKVVVKKYGQWKKALGISWKEYLSEIANNPLTGEWARAVARYLIETGYRADVKNG